MSVPEIIGAQRMRSQIITMLRMCKQNHICATCCSTIASGSQRLLRVVETWRERDESALLQRARQARRFVAWRQRRHQHRERAVHGRSALRDLRNSRFSVLLLLSRLCGVKRTERRRASAACSCSSGCSMRSLSQCMRASRATYRVGLHSKIERSMA